MNNTRKRKKQKLLPIKEWRYNPNKVSATNIPKDVWVLILMNLDKIHDILKMRQTCKYMNVIVKQKLNRFWFRNYLKLMIQTGNYAKQYGVDIPLKHTYCFYIKEIDMEIPFYNCHIIPGQIPSQQMVKRHQDEYNANVLIAKDILAQMPFLRKFKNANNYTINSILSRGKFPDIYAKSIILKSHYVIGCDHYKHYEFDLPIDENDDAWFKSHTTSYNKHKCYVGHYLITCYRIRRKQMLPNFRVYQDSKDSRKYKVQADFDNSIFYNRPLEKYKCV